MTADEARDRFADARSAVLATAGADGAPHLVPIVFALAGDTLYSAVDAKPKRTRALRRLANIEANPQVSVLVEHYDDGDWSRLWWARADGTARLLDVDVDAGAPPRDRAQAAASAAADPGWSAGAPAEEAGVAIGLLVARYPQYAPGELGAPEGPVIAIDVARWSGWTAA